MLKTKQRERRDECFNQQQHFIHHYYLKRIIYYHVVLLYQVIIKKERKKELFVLLMLRVRGTRHDAFKLRDLYFCQLLHQLRHVFETGIQNFFDAFVRVR